MGVGVIVDNRHTRRGRDKGFILLLIYSEGQNVNMEGEKIDDSRENPPNVPHG